MFIRQSRLGTLLLPILVPLLLLLGCSSSAIDPDSSHTLPDWMNPDGSFELADSSGHIVSGEGDREGAVTVRIVAPSTDEFGMTFLENGFREWSIQRGVRNELEMLRDPITEIETYRYNGQRFVLSPRDAGAFDSFVDLAAAKLRLAKGIPGDEELPLEMDLGRSGLYDNPLGSRLVEKLDELGKDLASQDKFVAEDGTCTGDLMTVLGACISLKCGFLGGWANPLCHTCVGAYTACVIATIVHLIGGPE